MSNEAFDIWLKENYLVDMSEFIVDEQERTYIKENNLLRKAWQAARADSESILSEQQNTIAKLNNIINLSNNIEAMEITQLKACKEALAELEQQLKLLDLYAHLKP